MPERLVRRGDVNLHVRDDGVGPAVLFLHGWPDTGELWSDIAGRLGAEGFRCVVPDLRGCGKSAKPEPASAYQMAELILDAAAILDQCGIDRAHVVGHDWGASLSWAFATYLPDRTDHLAVLSVGHPTAFRSVGLEQLARSWYTLVFANPALGPTFLRMNDHEVLRQWMGHPRAEDVIRELERDGQLEAHLRWYEANLPPDNFLAPPPILPPVQAPTLGIWSSGDVALCEKQMVDSAAYCANGFSYQRVDECGHWLPLDAAPIVADSLVSFFPPTT